LKVAILGSTGFLGTQILEVLSEYSDSFEICLLSGFKNYRKLREQIDAYHPDYAFLKEVEEEKINNTVFLSEEKLREVLFSSKIEGVFIASAGLDFLDIFAGLLSLPKTLWVASKELMIVAGEILKSKISVFANQNLIPLDSEHYALWSILKGMQDPGRVEKVYLTASGGPFYEWRGSFEDITPEMTLAHPNWKMGDKITVDSATLVNKGLEVIEACYLFELSYHQVDVFVQRESYLHAGVRLKDGMYHMVMFPPDMRKVIRASLYPFLKKKTLPRPDLFAQELGGVRTLSFDYPVSERFQGFYLALEAARKGGGYPAFFCGADQACVEAFLTRRLSFGEIAVVLEECLQARVPNPSDLQEAFEIYQRGYHLAKERIVVRGRSQC